jgi:hypothetical protein
VRASLARDPAGDIAVTLALINTGTTAASNVQPAPVSLNGTVSGPQPSLGTIPAGGSASLRVIFPASLGAPGTPGVLRVSGSFAGGNFTSSLRVTLP